MVDVRTPTLDEAVSWIRRMAHDKQYCLSCFNLWREVGGEQFAANVLVKSPAEVIEFVERIGGRIEA